MSEEANENPRKERRFACQEGHNDTRESDHPYQRVCVAVLDYQDDRINTWKIWDLYECGDYALYNWYRHGWIRNNQSGWEPAWYIHPC
ncbi:hypothetical protein [Nonomuraea guangzhouensis]|uniref:Uncharacterized protein n=1 Tax=Nonomuraea guangzhouensis TaxID=1291555 RepID=A0ABW4G3F9_9ACTN|nr:hypothetical protein [Nonomuraea guangzhouensis]